MTLFFLDLNVWLALTVEEHRHRLEAWRWLDSLAPDSRLIFSRYTQLGLLRLLTNSAAMGEQTLTIRKAWGLYDQWAEDDRVEFYPEPRNIDSEFRRATKPFATLPASKWIGDCYLLAYASECGAALVTFDKALAGLARKLGVATVTPS